MIVPFINFAGQATEAIALYESAFKVENKQVFLYKDAPAEVKAQLPAGTENYVMHSEMTINGTKVWIGDSSQGITPGDMVSLSVTYESQHELRAAFDLLKVGGTILMELAPTFYSSLFGMVKDRFGIVWSLICNPME